MLKNLFKTSILLGVCAAVAPTFASSADDDRTNTGKKGSLVILPSVELRYDSTTGDLIQDTFVTLSNDFAAPVRVKVYYLNGNALDWTAVDFVLTMTPDEPYYWSLDNPTDASAFGQRPRSFRNVGSPVTETDAYGRTFDTLRGAVIMYALSSDADKQNTAIRWNHLSAKATAVNYVDGSAYEYNAYAFQSHLRRDNQTVPQGAPLSSEPTEYIRMDGIMYDGAPDQVLVDAFADGSTALSGGGISTEVNTRLNTLVLDMDLRSGGDGPTATLAFFTVHRQDEVPLTWSNQNHCIICWESTYLAGIRADVFDASIVNADRVKARIQTFDSYDICYPVVRALDPNLSVSYAQSPLIGVTIKELSFEGQAFGTAASPLVGEGGNVGSIESATIKVGDNGGPIIPGGELGTGGDVGDLAPTAPPTGGRKGRNDR
ncbi:MAG: hypothetical protein KDA32_15290 [Phycisphaerales bacterium]|nr:hypothetical protein [Phycisphaerales bacterium]